ncbi:MAG: helix-turn-helix transcriptional regulator [Clostridia bacterium]|nr:helix-turn-helix transcriptional regulator [Oscillospiraceae bacterium]MBQ7960594.1 helix-turn-helix transcriptional regulator [Clostridia bacterium]
MNYKGFELGIAIQIGKLFSVHYFEYSKNFSFHGEKHNFWEFVYVDKGEVTVTAGEKDIVLSQGNVIFHKPDEWHNVRANGKIAPNVAIVSFECESPAMKFFEGKVLKVGQEQKNLISKIISEYTNAFSTPLGNIFTEELKLKEAPDIGAEQLIKQYIGEFLILFLRQKAPAIQHKSFTVNNSSSMVNILENFMMAHISETMSIDRLMKYSGLNRMGVNRLFKYHYGVSPIQYFIQLKIELAKKYIREDNYNITQISELLGYSSIHYFSIQFKKTTGMTPSEYSNSIKAMSPLDSASQEFLKPERIK